MPIALFDTYCGSMNSGDAIIMDAVIAELDQLFPLEHIFSLPTHLPNTKSTFARSSGCSLRFVGGTNLLSSKRGIRADANQWAIGMLEPVLAGRWILLGAGWKAYQKAPKWGARLFYRLALERDYLHSVRDTYSERQLRRAGITNVATTGCPTLWALTEEHCRKIPAIKGENAVFTLTDYRQSPELDGKMLGHLRRLYRQLFFWPQGAGDLAYLNTIAGNDLGRDIEILTPRLSALDEVLQGVDSIDYVGTRLHAGIRALQHARRTLIIGVDNRAEEKHKDFNLPVLDRERIDELGSRLNEGPRIELKLPWEAIERWRGQFRSAVSR